MGDLPPTVMREGPFGRGMCQLWIDVDESIDLVALARSDRDEIRRIAVLDAVINNADRKGGHLLPTAGGHVYGVDHGVCFSIEEKLRTRSGSGVAGRCRTAPSRCCGRLEPRPAGASAPTRLCELLTGFLRKYSMGGGGRGAGGGVVEGFFGGGERTPP